MEAWTDEVQGSEAGQYATGAVSQAYAESKLSSKQSNKKERLTQRRTRQGEDKRAGQSSNEGASLQLL